MGCRVKTGPLVQDRVAFTFDEGCQIRGVPISLLYIVILKNSLDHQKDPSHDTPALASAARMRF